MHLAPFWSRYSAAGGGTKHEAVLGAYASVSHTPLGPAKRQRLMPFYGWVDRGAGRETTYVLPPLGLVQKAPDQTVSYLVPFYLYGSTPHELGLGPNSTVEAAGEGRDWQMFVLPGLLMKSEKGRMQAGAFPIVGYFERFLTFEKLMFVLWPLYVRAERSGRKSHYFLFPVLGWTSGGGESSFRLWPLFSHTKIEGRFDRWFFLWPFIHYQRNHLGGGGEEPETKWAILPFYGQTSRGTFRSWTALWPFFGYARDPRSDFWAWDGPWPFVRFQRKGKDPEGVYRSRMWPFYSYLRADSLEATNYLWPFLHDRVETYEGASRHGFYVLPFYQHIRRLDKRSGAMSRYRLVWPLWQTERNQNAAGIDGRDRFALGALSPFGRNEFLEHHYAWIWELYAEEHSARGTSARSWGGLWVRESDEREDRRSIAGLWSRRKYAAGEDKVRETSLLFGLLRWRSSSENGTTLLWPAFPGPGWPAERVGTTHSP